MRALEALSGEIQAALDAQECSLAELSWHCALLVPRAIAVDERALRNPRRYYDGSDTNEEALEACTLVEWRRQASDALVQTHAEQR